MSMCPVCNNPIDSQAPVCPHCGFKLLGATQRFEPVSFGDDALHVAAAPQAAPALHVVRGPQTGVTYQLGDHAQNARRSARFWTFDRGGRCALPYNSPVGLSHGRVRSWN